MPRFLLSIDGFDLREHQLRRRSGHDATLRESLFCSRVMDVCLRLGPREKIEHRTFPAESSRLPRSEQLTGDERDRLVERGPARTGVTHRAVFVPDRHAAEEDEPVRG